MRSLRTNNNRSNQLFPLKLLTINSLRIFLKSIRRIYQQSLRFQRKEIYQLACQFPWKLPKSRFLSQLKKRLKRNRQKILRKTRLLVNKRHSLFNLLKKKLSLNQSLNKNPRRSLKLRK